jgi:hypothetical protein
MTKHDNCCFPLQTRASDKNLKVFKQTEAKEFMAVQVKVFDYDEELFPWITMEETYIDDKDEKRKVRLDVEYRAQFDEVASTVRDLLVKCIRDAERELARAEAAAKMGDKADRSGRFSLFLTEFFFSDFLIKYISTGFPSSICGAT